MRRKDIAYEANISQVFSGRISNKPIHWTCIFNIRDITHQQTQEIVISSQMTIVEKKYDIIFYLFSTWRRAQGQAVSEIPIKFKTVYRRYFSSSDHNKLISSSTGSRFKERGY